MATNLAIDDVLLREAQTIGRHKTKKATVTEVLNLFGKIDYDDDYDYKKGRRRS